MNKILLNLAGVRIAVNSNQEIMVTDAFDPFVEKNFEECDYTIYLEENEKLDEYECLEKENELIVHYPIKYRERLKSLRGILIELPVESILLKFDRLIFHSSLIDSSYGGILFTGNSGVGKSTQADLWHRYADASVINGDRAILAKEKNGWRAYGSPYAGSSQIYLAEDTDIHAIVVLDQGESNQIEKLPMNQAFRALVSQTSRFFMNREENEKVVDLLFDLIQRTQIYHLTCTPDERAVLALREQLEGK